MLKTRTPISMSVMKQIREMKHKIKMRKAGLGVSHEPLVFMSRMPARKTIPYLHGIVKFYNTHGRFIIRQFYYAVISGRIPNCSFTVKTKKQATNAYQKCKNYCVNLRMWGILPLDAIIDDTQLLGLHQYDISIQDFLKEMTKEYRSNWFDNQDTYVEVWCEKLSLARIIYQETNPLGAYLSVSGKTPTWSQLSNFKKRYEAYETNNILNVPLKGYILYFGDHDPSGIYKMDKFIENALILLGLNSVQVRRISINLKEALKRKNVGVPLKPNDKDTPKYIRDTRLNYGVELDALTPTELRTRVYDAISSRVNLKKLKQKELQDLKEASKMKKYLQKFP